MPLVLVLGLAVACSSSDGRSDPVEGSTSSTARPSGPGVYDSPEGLYRAAFPNRPEGSSSVDAADVVTATQSAGGEGFGVAVSWKDAAPGGAHDLAATLDAIGAELGATTIEVEDTTIADRRARVALFALPDGKGFEMVGAVDASPRLYRLESTSADEQAVRREFDVLAASFEITGTP